MERIFYQNVVRYGFLLLKKQPFSICEFGRTPQTFVGLSLFSSIFGLFYAYIGYCSPKFLCPCINCTFYKFQGLVCAFFVGVSNRVCAFVAYVFCVGLLFPIFCTAQRTVVCVEFFYVGVAFMAQNYSSCVWFLAFQDLRTFQNEQFLKNCSFLIIKALQK